MRKHAVHALINFDINMDYFKSLDKEEFNNEIEKFLLKNPKFEEVKDLNLYKGVSGYYMLILDEYSQAYIGTSDDIFKRIYKHWHKRKPFDRLIFGSVETSIMAITSFRPLDTSRIYVFKTKSTYSSENKYISSIPEKFMCNRTCGGKMDGGFAEAVSKGKFREKITEIEKTSIEIKYEDNLELSAVQLYEIYMYVIQRGFSMNTDLDGEEHTFSGWRYQGEYGLYSIEGNLDDYSITIKKVLNISW